ncbi:MAG: ferrochelatase, partial [Gammaproteobacteria bacterium]
VQIFCPGFAADCLETLEEIGVENKKHFIDAGGESYQYIDALNADEAHIDALYQLIDQNLQGWQVDENSTHRERRARELGAHH